MQNALKYTLLGFQEMYLLFPVHGPFLSCFGNQRFASKEYKYKSQY